MNNLKEKNDKLFGDVFAGEERELPDQNQPEKNTDLEKQLISHIFHHVSDGTYFPSPVTNTIIKCLRSGLYPDMIKRPNTKEVYRGMNLTHQEFDRFLTNTDIFGDLSNGSTVRTLTKPAVYKPLKGSTTSSWSKDRDVAIEFSKNFFSTRQKTGGIGLILIAQLEHNPNQLFDIESFYGTRIIAGNFSAEKEVLGLKNIVVTKIQWFILD